ncbi:hypothetical protein SD71_16185 [Cohnella kolymensis]|uniref:Uncharacterized protein n=1 Tax=Cohnella kolymensis TaxID=1590652 RepID=A0ABR5A3F3_9BACL|nr:hypothetical protein [Cohnella kolymensis]KIL35163.1 hypothetical protein SD71_16185 [Cohnella kolymensis]
MTRYLTLDDGDKPYFPSGVIASDNLILRASAIIEGHCKRDITVKSYTERVPLTEMQRGHLSYYPVVEVTALKGRPKYGITGDNFFGPPTFTAISDLNTVDVDKEIGALTCGYSPFGAPYDALEVTYTSGWNPIPDKVKVACGLLVAALASNHNSNVKSKKDFDFSIEYFGNNLVTPEIADLLSEYVNRPMR